MARFPNGNKYKFVPIDIIMVKVLVVSELNIKSREKVLKLHSTQKFDFIFSLFSVVEEVPNLNPTLEHYCMGSESCSNGCVPLGGSGIFKSNNLSFAYLEKDATVLQSTERVDVLLSYDWPAQILTGSELGKGLEHTGSDLVREIAERLKPRYHFSCSSGFYFEREPFREDEVRLTRFIGLAPFGGSKKEKVFGSLMCSSYMPLT